MEILDYLNMSPELQKNLTDLAKSNNLSMRELAQLCNMITIRETILQQHKSPITQNAKNKRWYTRLPDGKQIVKTKKEDLEQVLITYYLPEVKQQFQQLTLAPQGNYRMGESQKSADNCTLKTIYPQWLELRRYEVGRNTLADDLEYWKKYIATDKIADISLSQLSRTALRLWSCEIIKKHKMKKKYFANVKRTLNSLLDFALDEELLSINHLRSIKINSHLYTPTSFKAENEEVFTDQEQELVMKEAENDSKEHDSAIPLGICILFLTGMCIGELCALRNCDIDGNYLYVRRMMIENQVETSDGELTRNGYRIVEHTKSSTGMRKIYLPEKARAYFAQIKELNKMNHYPCADTDLMFQRKEGMCNQRVFDCRLKKYCNPNHLNLPFAKSCHDIRRSYISHLFDLGINPDSIRRMAGHKNIEMTMKYCRGRKSQEELEKILEQDFSG